VAVWEFPPEPPSSLVSLWPRAEGTPERKKRKIVTDAVDGDLQARVDGPDPGFQWHFATPIEPSSFRADVTADGPGPLQLFWSSRACPTFSEACSATQILERGRNVVAFLLDPAMPIRELRLDLPEGVGTTLRFHSLGFSRDPGLDTAWVGRDTATVSLDARGLTVDTAEADPWLIVPTPGLDAARVGGIEVTLRGTEGPAQVYWDGPCGAFAEACSVVLQPADSGSATHRASLASPQWRGPIRHLRFDPAPGAGSYRIERLVLTARSASQVGQKRP
jgi:hypothetical protein